MNEKNKKPNNERDKIKVQLSNIETFLQKIGFIKNKTLNKANFNNLNTNIIKIDNFEFNDKITHSEASVKYGVLIQSINKLFNSDISIECMHEQYLDYTKDLISLHKFINSLVLIDMIINNFSNILINQSFVTNLFNERIIIYDVSISNNKQNILKNKIDELYQKMKEKTTLKGIQVNNNLILLIYIISMGNLYFIDKNLPDLLELMNYITKYNNIFINNINIIMFLYIYVSIIINLHISSIKHRMKELNYEKIANNNLLYIEFNESDKSMKENNSQLNKFNLYIYDNENIFYQNENSSIKILMFQNYLKLYLLFHLSKNKIKCTINLSIKSFYDLLLDIQTSNNIQEPNKPKENFMSNIFEKVNNEEEITNLNFTKIDLLNKDNINQCFNSFNFFEFSIFITGFQNDVQVSKILLTNLDLIKKCKSFHLQESSLFKELKSQDKETLLQYSSTENLINSFDILNYILETFGKNNPFKKSYPSLLLIKLIMFKCVMNRDKRKEIQIFFDHSNMKEKMLFNFVKTSENILFLISKYKQTIELTQEFKQYNVTIRISQTNFIMNQLDFYFRIISKILVDYVDSHKYQKIEIYEKKLNNFNPNTLIYIKNNSLQKKERISQIKQIFHNNLYSSKIKMFNNYIEQLEMIFDIIVISNNYKEFRLLRTFDDNKLFIYLSKEFPNNLNEDKMIINQGNKKQLL